MRTAAILFFVSLFFTGCKSDLSVPADVIRPTQMQDVLWDVIRGDLLAQELIKHDSTKTLKEESRAISEKVFLLHNISREKFEKSMTFYEKHPAMMKVIFDSLHAIKTRRNPGENERKMKYGKEHRSARAADNKIP